MIRPATEADVPAILGMVRELAEYERAAGEVVAEQASFQAALFGADPVAGCLLAVDERDSVVGMAIWFRTFSTWLAAAGLYLEDLFVKPDARGRGHGRALLGALAEIAVQCGYGRVEWSVLDWNEPAHGFYRRLGAAPQDEWTVWRLAGQPLIELASEPS